MLSAVINNLVSDLKPRQREVLSGRFGLNSGEKKTLAEIGEKYDLTRERVRQIEEEALRTIQARLSREKEAIEEILDLISEHLNGLGGLRQNDLFLLEIRHLLNDNRLHHWHLRFLSETAGLPLYHPLNNNFHNFWYLNEKQVELAARFAERLENLIADKKEETVVAGRFHDYFSKAVKISRLPHFIALNYLSVSKKFGTNPFGDLGLSHWEEITPKTIGGKTYLILKKHGAPLHFRDIAEAINKAGFNRMKALPQTVHNELIKDPRFVLVGRGTYGLKERGFVPGTAKDVISLILKEKGPLSFEEIMDSVLKQRFLKKNTIVLNLQNRKFFRKMEDGRYSLK
jgi:DNA-directed RNA polymerase delta subunit